MDRDSKKRPLRGSIFFRLLVVIAISAIAIDGLIVGSLKKVIGPPEEDEIIFEHNIEIYLNLIWDKLGPEPSVESLQRIAKDTMLKIRLVRADGRVEASDPGFRDMDIATNGKEIFKPRGVTVRRGAASLTAALPRPFFIGSYLPLLLLLAAITAVVVFAYFVIRYSLSPLRNLIEGVEAVSSANFKYVVPEKGVDELARLVPPRREFEG